MSTQSLMMAASKHMEQGEPEAAESVYWEVLKVEPKNVVASLNLASLLFDRGKFDEAATLCRVVADQEPELPILHVLLSRIAFVRGNFKTGLEHITRAHATIPDEPNIAAEFVSAQRRHYWTLDTEQYPGLFEKAASGGLDVSLLPRLVHQTLARLIRPRFLELLCGRPQDEQITSDDVPLFDQWARELGEGAREDFGTLRRNFENALTVMRAEPAFGPRSAIVRLRDGSVITANDFIDMDPLTSGAVELVDPFDGVRFVSAEKISRIQLAGPAEVMPALVTLTDGEEMQALMPIFGFFTTFSPDARIRSGRATVARKVSNDILIPLGVRAWQADGRMIPMMNVESIEYLYD